jgi:glucose-6-phosphate 1-dehydrogenase
MTSRIIVVPPFDYVVFGGTGDLAQRKLLPALYRREWDGQLPADARIIGVSRREMSLQAYLGQVRRSLEENIGPGKFDPDVADRFLSRIQHISADGSNDKGWPALQAVLRGYEDRNRAFYLATDPDLIGPICRQLAAHGLATQKSRLVVEKPIGRDLASAQTINDAIGDVFPEESIYRIDHYLGKETVQNLMALRFANALFEPLWNSAHIDHVQITVAETLGVEGRASYYDRAGALRDMVQNHMLQLLCLIAMEPPATLHADAVRDEKLKVLRALKPISGPAVHQHTVRGQYRSGANGKDAVPGYIEELGPDRRSSETETFVALKAEILNWRWAGVPFYLRTGKRQPARVSEIIVAFRHIPHSIFDEDAGGVTANRLVIRLQPDEGIKLWLMIKDPGPGGMRLRYIPLDMTFNAAFGARNPDAYERLLLDVIRGNQTLFMRRDEVEAAWAWIDPILDGWRSGSEPPKPYQAGTWGPTAAIALIERDGRTWHEDLT